jgi:hypothetical protein
MFAVACNTLVKIDGENELVLTSALPSPMELELLNRALTGEGLAAKVEFPAGLSEEKRPEPQSSP